MGITNDKGRLSKEEIERMINDAEQYKAEDEKQKERIGAKNNLESYCFNMKSTLDDEKLKDKIKEEDKETITKKCDEIIKWLDANQLAEVDEFQDKRRRLKVSATRSSLNYTNKQEVLQEVCPEACPEECLEVCPVVCQEQEVQVQDPVVQEDQQLKKLIKPDVILTQVTTLDYQL